MKHIITQYFSIQYQEELRDNVRKSLQIFDNQLKIVETVFGNNINTLPQKECFFFANRNNFVDYIKNISNGKVPPKWATGCFYNNGIQILMNVNNPEDNIYTLTHEYIHLCIQNLLYDKYKINRITWFDESFAGYLDGHLKNTTKQELQNICTSLKSICNDLDLKILNNPNKIITKKYNGYEIFEVVGIYIFENNLQNKLIELLQHKPTKLNQLGKTILKDSIQYIENNNS